MISRPAWKKRQNEISLGCNHVRTLMRRSRRSLWSSKSDLNPSNMSTKPDFEAGDVTGEVVVVAIR